MEQRDVYGVSGVERSGMERSASCSRKDIVGSSHCCFCLYKRKYSFPVLFYLIPLSYWKVMSVCNCNFNYGKHLVGRYARNANCVDKNYRYEDLEYRL